MTNLHLGSDYLVANLAKMAMATKSKFNQRNALDKLDLN